MQLHDTQSLGHCQHGAEAGSINLPFGWVNNEAAVLKLVRQPGHRH